MNLEKEIDFELKRAKENMISINCNLFAWLSIEFFMPRDRDRAKEDQSYSIYRIFYTKIYMNSCLSADLHDFFGELSKYSIMLDSQSDILNFLMAFMEFIVFFSDVKNLCAL